MRWRKFFTPVASMSAKQAKAYIDQHSPAELTILDVRQPSEYESGHIPGAKLIPVPELSDRMGEIDANKPVIVYCAMGGRSRVAAQMLSGKGFDTVYNLIGGYMAWSGESAYGSESLGLHLFSGNETPEDSLVIAYSLEAGLEDFYISSIPKTANKEVKSLFEKLAKIEVKHQDRILVEYENLTGKPVIKEEFQKMVIKGVSEGGMTTEEYTQMFNPDWNKVTDVVELAMSIEAQAYDLYSRAADRCTNSKSKESIFKIALEEKEHLKMLGNLISP